MTDQIRQIDVNAKPGHGPHADPRADMPRLRTVAFLLLACVLVAHGSHHPTIAAPATLHPPGGLPVCTVHGAAEGVEVAQRTPAATAMESLPPTW